MARRMAAVAIGAGMLLFALRVVTGNPAALSFVFALGVMVALVPEGLPATLSVSLAIGVRRMARRHALIKKLAAVEALGSTSPTALDGRPGIPHRQRSEHPAGSRAGPGSCVPRLRRSRRQKSVVRVRCLRGGGRPAESGRRYDRDGAERVVQDGVPH
jgi:E1-E2 ATPase